jgi:tRNA (guanine37-N1)-methyltransferase
MTIDILTLFPEMFQGPFDFSIVKRARENKTVEINIHNLRDWATDKYKSVDDHPYGGGAGMVMRVDIIDKAVTSLKSQIPSHPPSPKASLGASKSQKVILLDAGGEKYNQKKAIQLSKEEHLIFICGHYEGVDYRVRENIADEVISVGDYVLSGGELPAMTIIDTIVRLLPGVLGNEESLAEESHNTEGKNEYPQYTRPEEYKGWKVPEILMSGNHKKIKEWRDK